MSPAAATSTSLQEQQALPELFTVKETAEVFRVDPRTIERWSEEGRLPRVKLAGRTVRYRLQDISALIASGCEPS